MNSNWKISCSRCQISQSIKYITIVYNKRAGWNQYIVIRLYGVKQWNKLRRNKSRTRLTDRGDDTVGGKIGVTSGGEGFSRTLSRADARSEVANNARGAANQPTRRCLRGRLFPVAKVEEGRADGVRPHHGWVDTPPRDRGNSSPWLG